MLGMVWAFAYMLVGSMTPDAFAFSAPSATARPMDRDEAFYFSFVTLSTVGYGDITPVSHAARMLAVVEAMTGLLYVAVLIARLVSMYSTHPPQREKLD
jgi:voltage-gated potassium channel Kch